MKNRMMFAAASLAAICMSATGAAAEEQTGKEVNYGFHIEASELDYAADYKVVTDEAGNGKISFTLNLAADGEEYSIPLEDFMILTEESLYLNVEDIKTVYETVQEEEIDSSILESVGITGEWVELPLPDLEALDLDVTQLSETPELSEELMGELQMLLLDYFPSIEEDGKMTITIDNEKAISTAKQLDEILANYGEEISGLLEGKAPSTLKDLDIKPAIQAYIQAAAEGAEEADAGYTAEEAEEMIGEAIDNFMATLSEEASVTGGDFAITADTLAELNLEEMLTEALGETEFEGKIVIDGTNAECTLTVNGEAKILKIGLTEEGSIAGTLEDSTGVLYSGEAVMEGAGYKLTVTNEQTQETVLTGTLEIAEEGNLAVDLTVNADGEEVKFSGYLNTEELAEAVEIEIPEAVSGLEVTKKISTLFFSMMADTSEAE